VENKLIKFNDTNSTIINVSDILTVFGMCESKEYKILFQLRGGIDMTIYYKLEYADNYKKDLDYLNSLTSRR